MRPLPPSLTLLVPGLLDPLGPAQPPRLPALEWLLARADREGLKTAGGLVPTLFCLFEVALAGEEPPVGAVCRYGEGAEPDDALWFRADPVHLLAQQDRVYLLASDTLDLSADESAALIAELNRHFAADRLRFEVSAAGRWYLRLPEPRPAVTTPLYRALGSDIHPYLPRGPAAPWWRALLNEIQMLLHLSPVNEAREAAGRPVVNGLWIWGGGPLVPGATSRYQAVYSSEPLGPGLARLATVGSEPLPADLGALLAAQRGPGRLLAVDDRLLRREPALAGPEEGLLALESAWFAPAREALRGGRLASLEILPADGRLFRLGRRATRRFWRRCRPLAAHLPVG